MAFNFFKKKEEMEFQDSKNKNDIIEDFGSSAEEYKITSFDSNFNEAINEEERNNTISDLELQDSKINEIKSFDTNAVIEETNNENTNLIDENVQIDNTNEYNNNVNDNNYSPVNNINNYEYNPIMDNMEQIQDNIKNSEDIGDALSKLHNKKSSNEEKKHKKVVNDVILHTNLDYDTDPGYKKCPKCGQKVREDYKECFMCGAKL
ncbi:MAG: zinc ribbon domain-containing protein [Firmicutes bacterium]|nr:zinc ribbon domain-containing protein [Bacillota bacterium]